MKMKMNECNVDALWGKIAVVSWGDPSRPPVLMFHGFMDTAATFSSLVDLLPDSYYYVGFDYPGHGKSEPFPEGPLVTQADFIEVVRMVVDSMKWDSFVVLAHSMGITVATLYNTIYPGKIKKIVAIDPGPGIVVSYIVRYDHTFLANLKYGKYYQAFGKLDKPKLFTYKQAVSWMAKNRRVSEDQAKILLSRSLVSVGDGKYKLSWDLKAKYLAPLPMSEDVLLSTMIGPVPILVFVASEHKKSKVSKFANNFMEKWLDSASSYSIVPVTGHHDVHVANPAALAPHIKEFLEKDFDRKSKL